MVKVAGQTGYLKALDTFGNCQRPAFSLGVSQHMHKITHLRNFLVNLSSKVQENNERKNTLVSQICVPSEGRGRQEKLHVPLS